MSDYRELVVQELQALGHDPNATMEDAKAKLETVWNVLPEGEHRELVVQAFNGMAAIVEAHHGAVSIAAAAKEVAATMQKARDELQETLTGMEEAVDNYEYHEYQLLQKFYQQVEEQTVETLLYGNGESHYVECVEDAVTEIAGIEVDSVDARTFYYCLVGETDMSDELREELAAFITSWVAKRDLWAGEFIKANLKRVLDIDEDDTELDESEGDDET